MLRRGKNPPEHLPPTDGKRLKSYAILHRIVLTKRLKLAHGGPARPMMWASFIFRSVFCLRQDLSTGNCVPDFRLTTCDILASTTPQLVTSAAHHHGTWSIWLDVFANVKQARANRFCRQPPNCDAASQWRHNNYRKNHEKTQPDLTHRASFSAVFL